MTRRHLIVLSAGLALLAGCTSAGGGATTTTPPPLGGGPLDAARLQLVAFDSCEDTLDELKAAAKTVVGPWGFGYGGDLIAMDGAEARAGDDAAAPQAAAELGGQDLSAPPGYSGTNVHEAGVDEPDIVKTDGKRIITVGNGALWVIDAASKRVTGHLSLIDSPELYGYAPADLLIAGDHALVLMQENYAIYDRPVADSELPAPLPGPQGVLGPRLMLVDLASSPPSVLSTYTMDGSLIDARQIGTIARVVLRSAPRLEFRYDERQTDQQRMDANKDVIDDATANQWLPRYEVTGLGTTSSGSVGCESVSRPAPPVALGQATSVVSGTEMITVLTFDLTRPELGGGDPVTVVADGHVVYSTADSLYIAHDQRWRAIPFVATGDIRAPELELDEQTALYKFDIVSPGQPEFVASGEVPGWLLNQYSLSDWDGHLRVATTTGMAWAGLETPSESAVYVLRQDGRDLEVVGQVGGLGKGEQIYAVRFIGPAGYVVTFRQTDPLYTIDLRDPESPAVAGELKITGYSAYLHPAGDGRLIGLGQEATTEGRVTGLQVSLFDVADPAAPARLAQHEMEYGSSEAEYDPHAFLYWPQSELLVVPFTSYGPVTTTDATGKQTPQSGALALTVGSSSFDEVGTVSHPTPEQFSDFYYGQPAIRRSLMIGDVLWTISDAGVQANDAGDLSPLAWIPFL